MQFVFDNQTLDTERRELRRGGAPISVQPQVFDLLVHLVQNRDRVVSKEDLIALVWGGRTVSDSTFTSRINAARTAIGDSGRDQKLIRTISRKGLRFVGTVHEPSNSVRPVDRPPEKSPERSPSALPLPDRPAIAVLPFNNMSGEREQEYFSDGISEDIITALSKLRWFFVIARNSSFTYKGKAVHMKQIGEELGVRYVLEGSVRKSGDRVRITAQLNDVSTGSHIWAERYDRDLTDVFAVQDQITEAIVAAIEPQLYAAEDFRARRKPPNNLDAWDLVMRALWHYWRVTRQDNVVAQALLEKAIAIDANYGQALSLLSVYFSTRRLDDSLAEFELALQLNSNFSLAQGYYGLALSYCGRWQEAHEAAQRAIRLSPRDPSSAIYYGVAAYAQFVGRNYHEAIALAREAIRQRGDLTGAYRVLTVAAGMSGQAEVATAALQELRRAQPNISLAWIANQLPWELDADREHYLEAFRRAGLD